MNRLTRAYGVVHAGVIWRKSQTEPWKATGLSATCRYYYLDTDTGPLVHGTSSLTNGATQVSHVTLDRCGLGVRPDLTRST
jgi:hypothetical protein